MVTTEYVSPLFAQHPVSNKHLKMIVGSMESGLVEVRILISIIPPEF
jgi:hypothetical protein